MAQRLVLVVLVLGVAMVGLAETAAALPVAVGPVGVSCTGPRAAVALGVPPVVDVTPPACTVTGLPG
ncbi:MAG: hypothetical protein LC624_11830 [Halobacteriales archaeon]|nr:hypothetical protein [Halobacteriales archaeon]